VSGSGGAGDRSRKSSREQALGHGEGSDVFPPRGRVVPLSDLSISVPQAGQPGLKLLARSAGWILEPYDYRAAAGFLALRRAFDMGAAAVVKESSSPSSWGAAPLSHRHQVAGRALGPRAALPHLQCRRVRAPALQGSRVMEKIPSR